jgi:ATP-dependent Clp protease ATP-binding subunit ClpB
LDDIIIFDSLSKDAVEEIVKLQVDQVRERLLQKEITLEFEPAALKLLAEKGYDPQFGARPLKRLIQNKILTPIASLIISKGIMKGGVVSVDAKGEEFAFDVKKGRKGSLIAEQIIPTKAAAE